jgi:hypothetical protein
MGTGQTTRGWTAPLTGQTTRGLAAPGTRRTMTPRSGDYDTKVVLREGGGDGFERRRWRNCSKDSRFCELGRHVELLGVRGGK